MERNYTYTKRARQERLVNRRRRAFRKRLHTLVAAVICSLLIIIVISANAIVARAGEGYEKQYQKQYVSILVESGDTVWNIAEKQLSVGYDSVADLVEEIGFINDLDSAYKIQTGTVLIVPFYAEV